MQQMNEAKELNTEWKWHHHRKFVYQFVKEFEPESILEAGCDKGGNLEWIIELFPNAKKYGCDVRNDDIEYSTKNFPEFEIKYGNIQRLPYEDKSIDVIIADMVLYQLGSDEETEIAINDMKRVAKKGIVISEPIIRNIEKFIPKDTKIIYHNWDNTVYDLEGNLDKEKNNYVVVSFKV